MTDVTIPPAHDRSPASLLRGYAAFFRRERMAHPRLAELDALADALEQITRDDVRRLRLLLGAFEPDDGVHTWLPALAAKLAALLPPD
jgi:hypothetical protein